MICVSSNQESQSLINCIKKATKAISVKLANPNAKEKNYHGLFDMGKILHMKQDSFSDAHIIRNTERYITNIQSYINKDSYKYREFDAIDPKDETWSQRNGPRKELAIAAQQDLISGNGTITAKIPI
ncbi:hypothetical protein [Olleya sp. AS48]|uniref:hypothetical protein n=1 Tax=Olleya sp. AS48 TaxID=3135774 RepID=UPI003179A719